MGPYSFHHIGVMKGDVPVEQMKNGNLSTCLEITALHATRRNVHVTNLGLKKPLAAR